MDVYNARRRRFEEQIENADVDACLITHSTNVTYLTGFTGDGSYLLVGPEKSILITAPLYAKQLSEECPDLEIVLRGVTQPITEAAAETLAKSAFRSVEFESTHLTVDQLETLKEKCSTIDWKPGKNRVEQCRQIKDDFELERIRAAIRMNEKAFAMFRAMLQPDDTEKQLCDAMEMYVRRAGGTRTSFPTIVAVGERAALPHAPPTNRKMRDAGFVLVDWGTKEQLYKSDLTRVLLFNHQGRLSDGAEKKLRAIYDVVLQAQQNAINALRPGVATNEVDAVARKTIADAGYGEFFNHGLGHGVGLDIHEQPFIRQNIKTELQPGMVLTIEPGIYLPDFGGVRIEDDVLITEDGCEVLSSLAKDWELQWCDF